MLGGGSMGHMPLLYYIMPLARINKKWLSKLLIILGLCEIQMHACSPALLTRPLHVLLTQSGKGRWPGEGTSTNRKSRCHMTKIMDS